MIGFCYHRRHAYFAGQVQAETEALHAIDPTPPFNPRVARLMQDWSRKAERDCLKGMGRVDNSKPKRKEHRS